MKKIISVILLSLICICVILPVSAENTGNDINLLAVIKETTPDTLRDFLTEASKHSLKPFEADLTDQPIFIDYLNSVWYDMYDKNADELIDTVDKEAKHYPNMMKYYVFGEKVYEVFATGDYGDTAWSFDYGIYGEPEEGAYHYDMPWIDDILNNNVPQKVIDSNKTIKNIFAIDDYPEHFGTALYFIMEDNSFYVKFYDSDHAGGIETREFEENEFRSYSKAYWEYRQSLILYDDDGNVIPTGGGSIPFLEFTEQISAESLGAVNVAAHTNNDVQPIAEAVPTPENTFDPWLWVLVAAVIVAIISVAAVFVFKKAKA